MEKYKMMKMCAKYKTLKIKKISWNKMKQIITKIKKMNKIKMKIKIIQMNKIKKQNKEMINLRQMLDNKYFVYYL